MGGLVEGAVLGAIFQILSTYVLDAARNVVLYRSHLDRLKSTLALIKPAIDYIENSNTSLHEIRAFTDRLIKGNQLIHKCCEVKWWNVLKRWYCARKLSKFEASLRRFLQAEVVVLHYRETKKISVAVSQLGEKMKEITPMLERLEIAFTNLQNGFVEHQEDHQKEMLERISAVVSNMDEKISKWSIVLKGVDASSYANVN